MSREDDVAVFRDTERLCKINERLKASVKNATAGQKLILEMILFRNKIKSALRLTMHQFWSIIQVIHIKVLINILNEILILLLLQYLMKRLLVLSFVDMTVEEL